MKKIKVTAKVYDQTTHEYVRKYVTHTISDELASMIQKEFAEADGSAFEVHGFGAGTDNMKIPGLRTPLCSQKRFFIEPMFHVIDEEGKEIAGWRGF